MKRRSPSNMCIDPPRPPDTPVSRPNSSAITRFGSVPRASACPCDRYVLIRKSSSRIARTAPTIVASSPIARCRNPPTLAFAYICPARSSKRRISSIVSSHSRASSSPSAMPTVVPARPHDMQRRENRLGGRPLLPDPFFEERREREALRKQEEVLPATEVLELVRAVAGDDRD